MTGRVAGLILAAGASTRFGSPKQLARIGDRTMLETVIQIAHDAGLDPILAVVPTSIAVAPDVVAVVNDDPDAGLSRSLQLGIRAVPDDVSGVMILLGDQPALDPELIARLMRARGTYPVVATSVEGDPIAPVLLERSAFPIADEAAGDEGLRGILRRAGTLVAHVDVAEAPADIDEPQDLERLIK
jgi:CTP:molybdopterin cytidylyltransferase MocA